MNCKHHTNGVRDYDIVTDTCTVQHRYEWKGLWSSSTVRLLSTQTYVITLNHIRLCFELLHHNTHMLHTCTSRHMVPAAVLTPAPVWTTMCWEERIMSQRTDIFSLNLSGGSNVCKFRSIKILYDQMNEGSKFLV